jgi:hypothetical protein
MATHPITRKNMLFAKADNGNWFSHVEFNLYADDGFGELVLVGSWPAMNFSSMDFADDYGL